MIRTAHFVKTPLVDSEFLPSVLTFLIMGKFILRSAGNTRQASHNLAAPCGIRYIANRSFGRSTRGLMKRISAQITVVLLALSFVAPAVVFGQRGGRWTAAEPDADRDRRTPKSPRFSA